MILIVDYGMGNLGSISNMLKKIGVPCVISSDPEMISDANKIILPGVGAFDNAIENLHTKNLFEVLNYKALNQRTPILGICLGMQLFAKSSEEGIRTGLGWIDASVKRFNFNNQNDRNKVPHMGWNRAVVKSTHQLFNGLEDLNKFYFVHSYHVVCNDESDILTMTSYGYDFVSSVFKDNILGVQFHPEKSHKYGMQLLKNFAAL